MTQGSEDEGADSETDGAFVGRKPELDTLCTGLERAISGRGSVLLIAGEPGIGKSELAERLAREAAGRGTTVLWGRAWEGEGAPPYWPWTQILRVQLHERDGVALETIFGSATPYLAQIVPELLDRLPDLPPPPPIDSEQARFRLFDAITACLKSSAASRPLVLILDDLHWADKPSLLLLRFLAREMSDSHLLVLGTYRDVEVSRGHPLSEVLPSLRQERTVERLLLRGLAGGDVRAMLFALHGAKVPEGLADAISRETEGNPFFIREIVRHLIDEGIIDRDGTAWTSRWRIEDMRLPESVRDVIGRRLGRLSESCLKTLTAASLVGREFGLDVLERIADLEAERELEVLEEAVAARVIEEVPQAPSSRLRAGIGRYRFSHALIRETLYEELRTLERVRGHRRVAEVLEALYARNPGPHLAELAHHFLEALPGGDVDKAVDYAMRAGDRAGEQLAYEEAALLYERALQALELVEQPDEKLRCELLMKLGEARWSAGGLEKPMESFRRAGELAEGLGDAELLARAALAFAGPGVGIYVLLDEDQLTLLTKALAALEESDSALRAQVMARHAAPRVLMGDPQGGVLGRAAIEMARRIGDKRALAYVLNVTPWAVWGPDNLEERLAVAEEVIRLGGEIGDVRLAAEGHVWKACHLLEVGDIAGFDRETSIQEHFAETSRQAYHRWMATVSRGGRAVLEGRFGEAEKHLRALFEAGIDVHTAGVVAASKGFMGILLEQQGRGEEMLAEVSSYEMLFPQVTVWKMLVASLRAKLGQTEAVRSKLESLAVYDFSDIPRDLLYVYNMSQLCDVVSFLADSQRAGILYDLLLPYADRCTVGGSNLACRGSVSRPLGVLATLLCRYEDAEKHFERALEMNARIRARIWVAHTQHDYARMLVARDAPGDRDRAAALAAESLATAREVGMKPLEAKVLELQAAGLDTEVVIDLPAEAPAAPAESAVFRRDGDVWIIAYGGQSLRLKDAKGLRYVAQLLGHEGRELHAADLAAATDGDTRVVHEPDGEVALGLGDAGDVLDPVARKEYRQRLEDLRAELEEATSWGDSGRAAKLGEEIEFLTAELSAAFGLGGRARKAGDVADRARKAVTSRIRETITRIAKEHPVLGRHLENAIRTGIFCSYTPDHSPHWEV